jgi:hypothetical protein
MVLASGRERGEEGFCYNANFQTFKAVVISMRNQVFIHHLKIIDLHGFGLWKRERRGLLQTSRLSRLW